MAFEAPSVSVIPVSRAYPREDPYGSEQRSLGFDEITRHFGNTVLWIVRHEGLQATIEPQGCATNEPLGALLSLCMAPTTHPLPAHSSLHRKLCHANRLYIPTRNALFRAVPRSRSCEHILAFQRMNRHGYLASPVELVECFVGLGPRNSSDGGSRPSHLR